MNQILKKFDNELDADYEVLNCENADALAHLDDEDNEVDENGVSTVKKENEIVITICNVPTGSILTNYSQSNSTKIKESDEERKDFGKYAPFYNPPLCEHCGMEKLLTEGIYWLTSCK